MLKQTVENLRTRGSLCRTLMLALPILGLAGCIPQHVRDVEWCRNIETAKALTDQRAKANLTTAMTKNKCAAKLLEAQKVAAQKAAAQKKSTPPPPAPKRVTKSPAISDKVKH